LSGFEDDAAFKNLAKKPFSFHRLSWHCNVGDCGQCDGLVHYNVKVFQYKAYSEKTKQERDVYEDIVWDTNHNQVQLEGGVLQSRENTPEGSKCECFCHKPRPSTPIPAVPSKLKSEGKKLHEMLSPKAKKDLR